MIDRTLQHRGDRGLPFRTVLGRVFPCLQRYALTILVSMVSILASQSACAQIGTPVAAQAKLNDQNVLIDVVDGCLGSIGKADFTSLLDATIGFKINFLRPDYVDVSFFLDADGSDVEIEANRHFVESFPMTSWTCNIYDFHVANAPKVLSSIRSRLLHAGFSEEGREFEELLSMFKCSGLEKVELVFLMRHGATRILDLAVTGFMPAPEKLCKGTRP